MLELNENITNAFGDNIISIFIKLHPSCSEYVRNWGIGVLPSAAVMHSLWLFQTTGAIRGISSAHFDDMLEV